MISMLNDMLIAILVSEFMLSLQIFLFLCIVSFVWYILIFYDDIYCPIYDIKVMFLQIYNDCCSFWSLRINFLIHRPLDRNHQKMRNLYPRRIARFKLRQRR